MAAPVDAGRAVTSVSTASSSWTVNLPGSIAAGDMLILFARSASGAGINSLAGWTHLSGPTAGDASDDTMDFYAKSASGSEGATMTVGWGASTKGAAIVWRVTGWGPTFTVLANPDIDGPTATTTSNVNPRSWSPFDGTKDWLFLSCVGMDSETATASNAALSNVVTANSGTGGAVATNCIIWGGSIQATNVSSIDIAAWTSSAPANGCCAFTIGVHATGGNTYTKKNDAGTGVGTDFTGTADARSIVSRTGAGITERKGAGLRNQTLARSAIAAHGLYYGPGTTDVTGNAVFGNTTIAHGYANRFVPPQSTTKFALSARIWKAGSPVDNVRFGVQTDDGSGKPSGTWVAFGDFVAPATSATLTTVILTGTLTAGTTYHVVVLRTGAASATDYYQLRVWNITSETASKQYFFLKYRTFTTADTWAAEDVAAGLMWQISAQDGHLASGTSQKSSTYTKQGTAVSGRDKAAFVQGSAGTVVTTGTGTVSLTNCKAGNTVFFVWVEDGASNDSTIGNHVNVQTITNSPNDSTFFQTVGLGSNNAYLKSFVGRVTADGTVSADITVGASGADCFAVIYEFSGVPPNTTLTAPNGISEDGITDYYDFAAGSSTTITFPGTASTGQGRLAVAFIGVNANQALVSATGETGSDWTEPVNEFASASGTAATVGIQTASLPSSGSTVTGGSITITSAPWAVLAFALKSVEGFTGGGTWQVSSAAGNTYQKAGGAVIGPSLPATLQDSFDRADGNIDADTTSVGGWTWKSPMHSGDQNSRVVSNVMAANASAARYDNAAIDHDFASDVRASFRVAALSHPAAGDWLHLLLRIPYSAFPASFGASSTYYQVRFEGLDGTGNDQIQCFRYYQGTPTQLTVESGTQSNVGDFAAGDEIAVQVREAGGTEIIVFWKPSGGSWAQQVVYRDTNASRPLTGQKVAIEFDGGAAGTPSTWQIDNLGVQLAQGFTGGGTAQKGANVYSKANVNGTGVGTDFTGTADGRWVLSRTGLAKSDDFRGSGADAQVQVNAGIGIAPFVGAGADVQVQQNTGSGVSPFVGAGADVQVQQNAGAGIAPFSASGPSVEVQSAANTAISPFVGAGADATTFVEAGSGVSPFVGAGASVPIQQNAGMGIAPFVGSGTRVTVYTKTGVGISPFVGSGADLPTYVESGLAKLDDLIASGGSASVWVESGLAKFDNTIASGADADVFAETGAGISDLDVSGVQSISGNVYFKTGAAVIGP